VDLGELGKGNEKPRRPLMRTGGAGTEKRPIQGGRYPGGEMVSIEKIGNNHKLDKEYEHWFTFLAMVELLSNVNI
jgi:hypothetical protein